MKKLISSLVLGLVGIAAFGATTYADDGMKAVAALPTNGKIASVEVQSVESDVLSVQQDVVGILRQALSMYTKGDIKETGDANVSFDYVGENESAHVKFSLDKYVSLMGIMSGNQEVDFVGTLHIDAKRNEGLEERISATIKFDASLKIIGDYAYFTLNKLDTQRTGTDDAVKSFDAALREIPQIEGKTIRFPIGKHENYNQAEILKDMNAVFDVLEHDALFTPKAKKANGYQLVLKRATAQKINLALGKNKNANLGGINFSKSVLMYSKSGDTLTLWADEKKGFEKTHVALVRTAGAYEFQLDSKGAGESRRSNVSVRISANNATIQATDRNYAFSLAWKDGQLAVNDKWREYSWESEGYVWNTVGVNGALTIGNADLSVSYNGKPSGHVKLTRQDNAYSYDIGLSIDYEGNISVGMTGHKLLEFGNYDIVKPTNYIDADDLQ